MSYRKHDTDMTTGSIWRLLLSFALPLLLGNLFQQLYNTVDSVVVGNYVGQQALAAVGSTGPIINVLIGTFVGLSAGAGVVISQYYGAHEDDNVHDAVHTAIAITLILGVLFTVIGILMVPTMLSLMKTPSDVWASSSSYLTVYFSGIMGLMLYNIGAGILRAVGDSRRPLYFLIVSAVLNIVLDLFFVIALDMGVVGVALATVISQTVSAVLVIIVLTRSYGSYQLVIKDIKINIRILRQVVNIGFPSALQQAITAFSNVFVQSYINFFGSACMAGWTSYSKLDQFILLPMMSISLAGTTFVGQNLGAGKVKRAKKGVTTALMMALISTAILIIPVVLFRAPLVSLFADGEGEADIIAYGSRFILLLSPFYLLCCVNQIYAGTLRGSGNTKVPMVIMLMSFVVFRQIYLYVVSQLYNTVEAVAFGYPAGWMLASAAIYLYYRFSHWEDRRMLITNSKETNE